MALHLCAGFAELIFQQNSSVWSVMEKSSDLLSLILPVEKFPVRWKLDFFLSQIAKNLNSFSLSYKWWMDGFEIHNPEAVHITPMVVVLAVLHLGGHVKITSNRISQALASIIWKTCGESKVSNLGQA